MKESRRRSLSLVKNFDKEALTLSGLRPHKEEPTESITIKNVKHISNQFDLTDAMDEFLVFVGQRLDVLKDGFKIGLQIIKRVDHDTARDEFLKWHNFVKG